VQPYPLPYEWKGGETLLVQAGAVLGTRFENREAVIPGAVTGSLVFSDNHVDLTSVHPETTLGQGIFFNWTWGADIEIRRNTITNASRNALESLDNYMDKAGRGSVVIAQNSVVTPGTGIPFPTPNTPNGIVVGWFYDPTGAADPIRNSKVTVFGNTLQLNGSASGGIFCLSDGASVLNNDIETKGKAESLGAAILASKTFVSGNQITGTGKWALLSAPWKGRRADLNTFALNDVKGFSSSAGDLFWAGNHNLFIGEKCKIVDTGIGNKMLVLGKDKKFIKK
jgi:hypothetical protein